MNSPDAKPATAPATKSDRRLHSRHTLQVQIELRQEGSDVPMRLVTTDLSRGGCYIQMLLQLPLAVRVKPPFGSTVIPLSFAESSSLGIPNSATASCSWNSKVRENNS